MATLVRQDLGQKRFCALLATRRAKPISCVTTIIVIPSWANSCMTSRTSPIISGSSAARWLIEEYQTAQERALAGTGGADDHDLVAPVDVRVDSLGVASDSSFP